MKYEMLPERALRDDVLEVMHMPPPGHDFPTTFADARPFMVRKIEVPLLRVSSPLADVTVGYCAENDTLYLGSPDQGYAEREMHRQAMTIASLRRRAAEAAEMLRSPKKGVRRRGRRLLEALAERRDET